jgi:hypothetical protein
VDFGDYELTPQKCNSNYNDGSMICDYHLLNFFRMERGFVKMLPSMTEPLKRLIGVPILNQNTPNRILIPSKNTLEDFIKMMTVHYKAVFYVLYDEDEKLKALCEEVEKNGESYALALDRVVIETKRLASRLQQGGCVAIKEARTFEGDVVYNTLPRFFQHMLEKFVAPQTVTLGVNIHKVFHSPTVVLTNDGLVLKAFYNPMERKALKATFAPYHVTTATVLKSNKNSFMQTYSYNEISKEIKVQLGLVNGALTITIQDEL